MARILIADDQAIIRNAITRLISKSGENWEICGFADNGRSAVEEAGRSKPDLAILDLRMPQLDGIRAGREIREMLPGTPVIIYTWVEVSAVEGAVRKAGLQGVVQKSDGGAILWAIRDALAGKTVFGDAHDEQVTAETPSSAVQNRSGKTTSKQATLAPERPALTLHGSKSKRVSRKRATRRPRGTP